MIRAPRLNSPATIAYGSFAVSVVVLGIKYLAYHLTGSVALYSDALESIVNIATAVAALIAIHIASLPPDDDHPYGHHKAEYLSAVAIGVLIIMAALAIFRQAFFGLFNPQPINLPWAGLAVSMVATTLNLFWSRLLITNGKRHHSAALVSDGKHLFTDVITSLGVVIGVILVILTGWNIIDSLLAIGVAFHVLANGWEVIRTNASGLLDETVPEAELSLIHSTIIAHRGQALEFHDLRTRHAGKAMFIDFHLVVPGKLSVAAAHDICDAIEHALKAALPGAHITIHVEPEHKAKHPPTT